MNKIKPNKTQKFFGQESKITERFIFVEELSDILINKGNENKNLSLKIDVYDSSESEFLKEKAILVLNEEIYNQLFAFLLCEIDVASKIREGLDSFTKIENVVSDFKKLTFKNEDNEQN